MLRLLANGLSNKLIARSLDISEETVKWHLKNLFGKLNAGARRHAVACAVSLDAIGRLSLKPSAASRFLEKPFSPEEAKPDLRANHEYLRVKYR